MCMRFSEIGELRILKSRFLIFISLILTFNVPIDNQRSSAQEKIPSYEWIDKVPRKHANCGIYQNYCVALKIDPKWVEKCMSGIGDAIHVEVQYFNKKGKLVGYGLDSHRNFLIHKQGKLIKVKEIISYPSASPYPASNAKIKFDSAKVTSVTCLSY